MPLTRHQRTTGFLAAAIVCALTLYGCSGGTKTGNRPLVTTVPASAPTTNDTAGPSAGVLDFSVDAGRIRPASPAGAARLLFAFLNSKYIDPPGGETPGTLLQTGQTDPTGTSIALDVYANQVADLEQACVHFAAAAGYFLGPDAYQLRLTGITPVRNGLLAPSKNFPPLTCPPAPKTSLDPAAATRPRVLA
ncbi:MAG TPA: hypothetical protein VGP92_01660, partial [Acidimicrobiia bacterium]|nr:hypothetical protein [Acidimicrobiia bacterium]